MRSTAIKILIALVIMSVAGMAHAQATRTWVSGVGDDANPCSRTAPCKTFAGAISKTASNGEINAIDSGGFGGVTITKPITIDGAGVLAGILNAGSTGIIVNTTGANDTVILRNLDINGALTGLRGISVIAVKRLIVEDCKIFGNGAAAPNGQGINIVSSTTSMFIDINRCTIGRNSTQGINVSASGAGSAFIAVDDTHLVHNAASGLELGAGSKGMFSHSWSIDNGSAGVSVTSASADCDVADSYINLNTFGLNASGGAIHLYGNQVTHNAISLQTALGGVVQSHANNAIINNTTNTLPTATVPAGQQ